MGLICLFGCASAVFAQGWQQLASDHFIVYFTQDEKFVKEVLSKAEVCYQNIASDLGYPRYSEFWTWDKRVKIYIYPDRDSFMNASNKPSWSEGIADYGKKQILSYAGSQGFIDGILSHETAHLIFRDFVGFKGEAPLWLDEGVAQWTEQPKIEIVKAAAKNLLNEGELFSVEDMIKLDIRKVTNTTIVKIRSIRGEDGKRRFLALDGSAAVNIYYTEAASLVRFLIECYGTSRFTDLCRQLRDGKSLAEALGFAYPTRISSVDELENEWLKYLGTAN